MSEDLIERLHDLAKSCGWEHGTPTGQTAFEAAAEIERLRAKLAEASRMLALVPGALNSFFSAGIEERENGSARRQENLMADGETLVSEIRHFLAAAEWMEKGDE